MTTDLFSAKPDCQIVSSRIINASQEFVYKAWSDPNHLKNWWGPVGFTNTFNEFDLDQEANGVLLCTAPTKETIPMNVNL